MKRQRRLNKVPIHKVKTPINRHVGRPINKVRKILTRVKRPIDKVPTLI